MENIKFEMDFDEIVEVTKGTNYELYYEIDEEYNDIMTMYKFYIKDLDGNKRLINTTNDFKKGIRNYISYILGGLSFYDNQRNM